MATPVKKKALPKKKATAPKKVVAPVEEVEEVMEDLVEEEEMEEMEEVEEEEMEEVEEEEMEEVEEEVVVAPKKKAAPKKTPAKATKKAPAAKKEKTAKAPTPPKVGSAKKEKKAEPANTTRRITVGGKRSDTSADLEIKIDGWTSRNALNHLFFERCREADMELPTKKDATELIKILEQLLIDITDVSKIQFAGGMFRNIPVEARAYSVPTIDEWVLVPAHKAVAYRRRVGDVENLRGSYDPNTRMFYPTGEEEGVYVAPASGSSDEEEDE